MVISFFDCLILFSGDYFFLAEAEEIQHLIWFQIIYSPGCWGGGKKENPPQKYAFSQLPPEKARKEKTGHILYQLLLLGRFKLEWSCVWELYMSRELVWTMVAYLTAEQRDTLIVMGNKLARQTQDRERVPSQSLWWGWTGPTLSLLLLRLALHPWLFFTGNKDGGGGVEECCCLSGNVFLNKNHSHKKTFQLHTMSNPGVDLQSEKKRSCHKGHNWDTWQSLTLTGILDNSIISALTSWVRSLYRGYYVREVLVFPR